MTAHFALLGAAGDVVSQAATAEPSRAGSSARAAVLGRQIRDLIGGAPSR